MVYWSLARAGLGREPGMADFISAFLGTARRRTHNMPSKMLIDAAHPEETRVVAVKGNRVEEFDYESANKKQLRGNIYLAKVTRVEPSLQAAFVDYGGNRHGFLAFTEIHPDYYQIPVADRQALLEAEAEEESRASAAEAAEDDAAAGRRRRRGRRGRGRQIRARARGAQAQRPRNRSRRSPASKSPTTRSTRRRCDNTTVAMEASDLVREVSEPAEYGETDEGHVRSAPEPAADDEDGEEGENGEQPQTIGQPVALKEGNGETVAEYRRIGRLRGRSGGTARADAPPTRPSLQDPGGHQAPPDHPRAGGEGGARQQGRGAHDLSCRLPAATPC